MKRNILAMSFPVIAACVLVAGCGGTTTGSTQGASTSRQAAGTSCPEVASWTFRMPVTNRLPTAITLKAHNMDCYDWSGVSTPTAVFNGVTLAPGETRTFQMEAADNVSRYWNITVSNAASGTQIGDVRLQLVPPRSTAQIVGGEFRRLGDPNSLNNQIQRTVVKMGPTSAPSIDLAAGDAKDLTFLPHTGAVWATTYADAGGAGA